MSRPHIRRLAATLVAGLVILVVAACGSGTSKKDVIARGNAICAATLRSVRGVVPPSSTAGSGTALSGYLKRVVPLVEKEISQLDKLPRPAQDKAVLNKYIAAVATAGGQYRTLAADARRNNIAAVARDLAALRSNPAGALAKQYGLTQCASAAGTSAP